MRRAWVLAGLVLGACQPNPIDTAGIHGVRTPPPPGLVHFSPSPDPTTAPSPAHTLAPSMAPAATPTPGQGSPGPTPTPLPPKPTPMPPTPVPSPVLELDAGKQAADTWITGPSLHRPRAGLVAGAYGGTLYAAEGENRASLEWVESDRQGWTPAEASPPSPGAPVPIGRRLSAVGVDAKRMVGVGGDESDVLDEVLLYTKDGATLAGRLPDPVMAACAAISGDTLIVAGGLDAQRALSPAVQRLDLGTQGVSNGQPMPQAVAGAAYALLNDKLYVVGGYTLDASGNAVPQTSMQVYDVAGDTWQRDGDGKPDSPVALPVARHSAAAAALGGKLYVVGGAGAGNGVLNSVSIFDPVKNVWSDGAAIPTARALHALAAFDGRLWAIGGRAATGETLTSVEIYQP